MFQVTTEQFTGPLDALASLIEGKKLAVENIPLSLVTDEFVRYIETQQPGSSQLADYVVILVRLLYLKSQNILRLPPEEPLFDQLQRFVHVKEARKLLQDAFAHRRPSYAVASRVKPVFTPPVFPWETLEAALRGFLSEEERHITEFKLQETIKIDEAITLLRDLVRESGGVELGTVTDKRHILLVYFLAALILIKSGALRVEQNEIFGKIYLKHAETAPES